MNLLPAPETSDFNLQHKLLAYPFVAILVVIMVGGIVLVSGLVDFKSTAPILAPYMKPIIPIEFILLGVYFIRNGILGFKYGKTIIPFVNKPFVGEGELNHKPVAVALIISGIIPLGYAFEVSEIIQFSKLLQFLNYI